MILVVVPIGLTGGDESVLSTQEYIRKIVEDVGEDKDFKGGSWVSAVEFVNAIGGGIVNACLGDIENYVKNGKLGQDVAIIKYCTPNSLGDLIVTLKDLSGTIHHKVINEKGYGKDNTVGSALILNNVSVFSLKPSMHYLNIIMRNVVKVFHKDRVPSNGSGVGGSGMNVIHQEDQYKLDEEVLNLALEEEVRAARAEQEWLEKYRQEQEIEEEHERQL
ncbi:GPCR kinase [Tanacetum coccineum]